MKGSEKQIEWALKIKEQAIGILNELKKIGKYASPKGIEAIDANIASLQEVEDAKFFIEKINPIITGKVLGTSLTAGKPNLQSAAGVEMVALAISKALQ